jgi:pimeloyl-ACP methyl ester carboxylesterase
MVGADIDSQTMNVTMISDMTSLVIAAVLVAQMALAQEGTPPPLRAPGTLIDVGGWKLHLNCTGTRSPQSPLVVLEPGVGDFSVEWSLVQPEVAKFARVCSYDRAGDGWSEMGPHPRTYKQIVYELHTLLERAGEKPPYVMAGQSYGGWLVRTYRSTYPSEVAGIVLVDAGEDDPERIMPDGTVGRASALATGVPIPPIRTSGPLRIQDIPENALAAMRRGIAATVPHANNPPRDLLPDEAKRMRTWALGQIGHIAAGVNPVEAEEIALLRKERMDNPQAYGDMPLMVITRGRADSDSTEAKEEAHRAAHKAIASASRRGRWVIAERSGHHVQIEQPELVTVAIADVLKAIQNK